MIKKIKKGGIALAEKTYQNTTKTIYRIFLILCCSIGLYIKTGLYIGQIKWYTLLYYTNWSNFFVLLLFLFLVIFPECNDAKKLLHMKGGITMMIVLTAVIYHFLLKKEGFFIDALTTIEGFGSFLLHYAVPFITVLDWLIWDRKGVFSTKAPLFWTIVPYIYFIFMIWIASKGSFIPNQNTRYPYDFIAVDLLGWERVLTNVIALSACYIAVGYFYVWLDGCLGKSHKPKRVKRYKKI